MTRPAQQVLNKSEFPFLLLPVMVPSLSPASAPMWTPRGQGGIIFPPGSTEQSRHSGHVLAFPVCEQACVPRPIPGFRAGATLRGCGPCSLRGTGLPMCSQQMRVGGKDPGLQLCLGAAWGPFPAPGLRTTIIIGAIIHHPLLPPWGWFSESPDQGRSHPMTPP